MRINMRVFVFERKQTATRAMRRKEIDAGYKQWGNDAIIFQSRKDAANYSLRVREGYGGEMGRYGRSQPLLRLSFVFESLG